MNRALTAACAAMVKLAIIVFFVPIAIALVPSGRAVGRPL